MAVWASPVVFRLETYTLLERAEKKCGMIRMSFHLFTGNGLNPLDIHGDTIDGTGQNPSVTPHRGRMSSWRCGFHLRESSIDLCKRFHIIELGSSVNRSAVPSGIRVYNDNDIN